eukprot:g140.t1
MYCCCDHFVILISFATFMSQTFQEISFHRFSGAVRCYISRQQQTSMGAGGLSMIDAGYLFCIGSTFAMAILGFKAYQQEKIDRLEERKLRESGRFYNSPGSRRTYN